MASFGNFIREEREKLELTQTELGAKLGINMTKISRIENDKELFPKDKLRMLADLFNQNLEPVKALFFGDKFAKEAYKYSCSDETFAVAEETVKYYREKNTKQGKLKF